MTWTFNEFSVIYSSLKFKVRFLTVCFVSHVTKFNQSESFNFIVAKITLTILFMGMPQVLVYVTLSHGAVIYFLSFPNITLCPWFLKLNPYLSCSHNVVLFATHTFLNSRWFYSCSKEASVCSAPIEIFPLRSWKFFSRKVFQNAFLHMKKNWKNFHFCL